MTVNKAPLLKEAHFLAHFHEPTLLQTTLYQIGALTDNLGRPLFITMTFMAVALLIYEYYCSGTQHKLALLSGLLNTINLAIMSWRYSRTFPKDSLECDSITCMSQSSPSTDNHKLRT